MRGTAGGRLIGARSGALVMLSCLVLTGCTGSPDDTVTAPTFVPVPSEDVPSATPSAEPSEPEPDPTEPALLPPELPEAATQQTAEGAAAFASWWFDTLNYATATGDTEALTQASLPECETCAGFQERITDAYSTGGRIEGGVLDMRVEPAALVQDGVVSMQVFGSAGAGVVMTASGETTTELTTEEVNLVMAVAWTGERWITGELVS